LAGIVCGFALHWNLIPVESLGSPHVLIPGVLICHYWLVRKIILVGKCRNEESGGGGANTIGTMEQFDEEVDNISSFLLSNNNDGELEDGGNDDDNNDSLVRTAQKRKTKRTIQKYILLSKIRKIMIGISILSPFVLSWNQSMVLSQCLTTILYCYCVKSDGMLMLFKHDNNNSSGTNVRKRQYHALLEQKRNKVLWRGYIVSDAMSMSSWCFLGWYLPVERTTAAANPILSSLISFGSGRGWGDLYLSSFVVAITICMLRLLINLVGLVVASKVLLSSSSTSSSLSSTASSGSIGDENGIFVHVFGWPLRWSKDLGDVMFVHYVSKHNEPSWIPFGGSGNTLGGSGSIAPSLLVSP